MKCTLTLVLAAAVLVACRPASNGALQRPDSAPPTAQEPMPDSTTFRATGTVRSVNVEGGCWRFEANDGKHYELSRGSAPAGLLADGKQAILILRPRPDLMSTCMVGPIVEVVRVEG